MALSKKSVEKAVEILKNIYDYHAVARFSDIYDYDLIPSIQNIIICLGEKEDGGYENVYIEIEHIRNSVLEKFQERKDEIPNSPIERKEGHITTIGWS